MNDKSRYTMKSTIASAIVLMILGWATPMAEAQAKAAFDLPAQPLADSLRAVGSQTNINLLFDPPLVAGRKAPALKAEVTADEALTRLLAGTGIKHEFLNERTIVLAKADAVGNKASSGGGSSSPTNAEPGKDVPKEGQKSADSFRVARLDQGANSQFSTVGDSIATGQERNTKLEEIVVTAQKREQRLMDVPIPVSVVDAQSLLESNQTQLREYFNQIPGLSLAQASGGSSIVSIRGITTGLNQNPTVGFTLDDIPLGASTRGGGGGLVPEINPADLARLEVLKGPQGTLYGASSMGGLIRYVSVEPSTDAVFGSVQAGTEDIRNGNDLGYNFYGAINIPLSNSIAARASAFVRERPGFIDNVETGQRGVNKEEIAGGRLSLLWQLSSDFSLKLGALLESDNRDGADDVHVPTAGFPFTANLHGLQQYDLYGTGQYDRRVQVYSAALNGTIDGVHIAAISGYNVNSSSTSADFSYAYGTPTDGVTFPNTGKTDKFTQEIRISSPIGSHVDVLFGGFYTRELSSFNQALLSVDRATHIVDGTLIYSNAPVNYRETAGFGDLTWKATDEFDLQIGGRFSHLTVDTLPDYLSGSFVGGSSITPESVSSANVFTYLVSPEYKITSNLMVYGRIANGYRPGGGLENPSPSELCVQHDFQCSYQPDKTTDFELGIKGTFFDRALSVDASAYRIDWKNLQLNLIADQTWAYTGNGSRAKSQGLEVAAEIHPLSGLTFSGWLTWDDAQLTQALPPGQDVGAAGDRLPYSSRFSGNLTARDEFPLYGEARGDVAIKATYIGDRTGEFTATETRQNFPGYTQTDLSAGVSYRSWKGSVYVNNVADARGVLLGGIGSVYPFAFDYIQPRTIGLTISERF
jgi:outer membrane receptor protein involved in Fe transport